MTQTEQIRRHLASGQTITPVEALRQYGCLRLAARIYDLRGSMKINRRIAQRGGKRFAEYWRAT